MILDSARAPLTIMLATAIRLPKRIFCVLVVFSSTQFSNHDARMDNLRLHTDRDLGTIHSTNETDQISLPPFLKKGHQMGIRAQGTFEECRPNVSL